jgi:hypothetical protein
MFSPSRSAAEAEDKPEEEADPKVKDGWVV